MIWWIVGHDEIARSVSQELNRHKIRMSSTTTAVPKLENGTAITFPSGDDVGALVVDLGSLYIQAGNAGIHTLGCYISLVDSLIHIFTTWLSTCLLGDEWPKHFSESFVGVAVDNAATHSEDILVRFLEIIRNYLNLLFKTLFRTLMLSQLHFANVLPFRWILKKMVASILRRNLINIHSINIHFFLVF